jgi:hypothetical protein
MGNGDKGTTSLKDFLERTPPGKETTIKVPYVEAPGSPGTILTISAPSVRGQPNRVSYRVDLPTLDLYCGARCKRVQRDSRESIP